MQAKERIAMGRWAEIALILLLALGLACALLLAG